MVYKICGRFFFDEQFTLLFSVGDDTLHTDDIVEIAEACGFDFDDVKHFYESEIASDNEFEVAENKQIKVIDKYGKIEFASVLY